MSSLDMEVRRAAETMKSNGLIVYPTDTIWGIGCDATSAVAVNRISKLKQRPPGKSFVLLIDAPARLESYVQHVPEVAWQLIEYSERPLTIIYDGAKNLPAEAIGTDGTVAIRITKDDFCKKLIAALKKPIVSTSANINGKPFPRSFQEIENSIIDGVDYAVNWRRDENSHSQPSAIIRLKPNGEINFIRS